MAHFRYFQEFIQYTRDFIWHLIDFIQHYQYLFNNRIALMNKIHVKHRVILLRLLIDANTKLRCLRSM